MILTIMIPFNIGDKVKVSEVYFLKPFCTVSDIQNADSFREVLVIDVKNNIKGNLQVLVEDSDLDYSFMGATIWWNLNMRKQQIFYLSMVF